METHIIDNEAEHRFELPLADGELAVSYYRFDTEGRIHLLHTEVPQHLSGQGIGSILAHGVFEIVRSRGIRAFAKCPFMAAYAARHPEYVTLLDG